MMRRRTAGVGVWENGGQGRGTGRRRAGQGDGRKEGRVEIWEEGGRGFNLTVKTPSNQTCQKALTIKRCFLFLIRTTPCSDFRDVYVH